MSTNARCKGLFALLAALVLALAVAACGDDDGRLSADTGTETTSTAIDRVNPDNNAITLTVGSKNFTEQIVLGEIYAQALEAAGYDVSTDLNLGYEFVALKALENGEISGYPEYTSTALTSFFDTAPEDVPGDPQAALDQAQPDFEAQGPGRLPADAVLARRTRSACSPRRPRSSGSPRSPTSRTTRT